MTERPETPDADALQQLWQGQKTEIKPMSVAMIRARAARYAWRARGALVFTFTLLAIEVAVFGRYAMTMTNPGARVGLMAILLGLGWATAMYSSSWPRRLPGGEATGEALLDFHRAELERHRVGFGDLMRHVGPLVAGLVIFAVGAALYGPHPNLARSAPILAAVAFWFVVAWFFSRRAERVRREKVAELDATRVDE